MTMQEMDIGWMALVQFLVDALGIFTTTFMVHQA